MAGLNQENDCTPLKNYVRSFEKARVFTADKAHGIKKERERLDDIRFNALLQFLQDYARTRNQPTGYIPSIVSIKRELDERLFIACWNDFLDMIESSIK